MSGDATIFFTCGARVPNLCGERETATLHSEYYLHYFDPPGWHIDLDGKEPIVRCPEHCTWVGSFPDPMTGEEIPAHWEDAP